MIRIFAAIKSPSSDVYIEEEQVTRLSNLMHIAACEVWFEFPPSTYPLGGSVV